MWLCTSFIVSSRCSLSLYTYTFLDKCWKIIQSLGVLLYVLLGTHLNILWIWHDKFKMNMIYRSQNHMTISLSLPVIYWISTSLYLMLLSLPRVMYRVKRASFSASLVGGFIVCGYDLRFWVDSELFIFGYSVLSLVLTVAILLYLIGSWFNWIRSGDTEHRVNDLPYSLQIVTIKG